MKKEFTIDIHSKKFFEDIENVIDEYRCFYQNEDDLTNLEEKLHDFGYKVGDYIEELYYYYE